MDEVTARSLKREAPTHWRWDFSRSSHRNIPPAMSPSLMGQPNKSSSLLSQKISLMPGWMPSCTHTSDLHLPGVHQSCFQEKILFNKFGILLET